MRDKYPKGPPFCVVGKCKRKAEDGFWFCRLCGDKYGNCSLYDYGVPFVGGLKAAKDKRDA